MTNRLAALPGVPPLIACAALLLLWEVAARALSISGLPPAHEALRQLPALLFDREALVNILDSLRRMATGFVLATACAVLSTSTSSTGRPCRRDSGSCS